MLIAPYAFCYFFILSFCYNTIFYINILEARKNAQLTERLVCKNHQIEVYEYELKVVQTKLDKCKQDLESKDSYFDELIEDKYKHKELAEKLEAENKYLLESIFELHKSNTEETFERIMRSIVFKKTGEQSPVEEHIEDDLDSIKDGLDCFKDSHASYEDDLACLDRCYMQTLYEAGED